MQAIWPNVSRDYEEISVVAARRPGCRKLGFDSLSPAIPAYAGKGFYALLDVLGSDLRV